MGPFPIYRCGVIGPITIENAGNFLRNLAYFSFETQGLFRNAEYDRFFKILIVRGFAGLKPVMRF
jgi:hypothetical protein